MTVLLVRVVCPFVAIVVQSTMYINCLKYTVIIYNNYYNNNIIMSNFYKALIGTGYSTKGKVSSIATYYIHVLCIVIY